MSDDASAKKLQDTLAARFGERIPVNPELSGLAELAAMAGHLGVVRQLIVVGADITHKDSLGYDAYTAAMFFGDFRGATVPPFDEIMAAVRPPT